MRITRHGQLIMKSDSWRDMKSDRWRDDQSVARAFYWPGILESEWYAASDLWRS